MKSRWLLRFVWFCDSVQMKCHGSNLVLCDYNSLSWHFSPAVTVHQPTLSHWVHHNEVCVCVCVNIWLNKLFDVRVLGDELQNTANTPGSRAACVNRATLMMFVSKSLKTMSSKSPLIHPSLKALALISPHFLHSELKLAYKPASGVRAPEAPHWGLIRVRWRWAHWDHVRPPQPPLSPIQSDFIL